MTDLNTKANAAHSRDIESGSVNIAPFLDKESNLTTININLKVKNSLKGRLCFHVVETFD